MSDPRNKYGRANKAARTDAQGIVHDSKGEMKRWHDLQILERAGEIKELRRQVTYPLVFTQEHNATPILTPTGRIATYTADFVYLQKTIFTDATGRTSEYWPKVIEDFKGMMDKYAKFKIAVFEAIYDCKVLITKA